MTAIAPSDIQFYLSNPTAGTGFSGIGTPGNSLGKYMSTSQVLSGVPLDDLFLDITGAQNAASQTDYQCVFMFNNTATGNFMHLPFVWLPLQLYTQGGAPLSVGQDPTGPVPFNQGTPQAVQINTPQSAPAGVTSFIFASMVYTQGLQIPDIPPQFCIALWIKRVAVNSPPLTPQTLSLQCTFATDA